MMCTNELIKPCRVPCPPANTERLALVRVLPEFIIKIFRS